ncbi:hypothetical protein CE91St30_27640 [Raoultibacter timonensis]|uniref:Uncharacterized protein n=1 Tax=Raoultibacter timonensis TaxID=1907662 RepID=A0ABN6MHG7_9ACTN|nr:hypothetical protein CE91St30_27640 [Raoultibacter timonensis]BDF52034.1 hypothetical protein CE91St31_27640 [Raoultibacter timonensis]
MHLAGSLLHMQLCSLLNRTVSQPVAEGEPSRRLGPFDYATPSSLLAWAVVSQPSGISASLWHCEQ